ncbi:hypothetical protein BSBH6_01429 [Bacillus subtilis]|nr:hypothetical protein BSBH6_01429 [Bacillus subtilis]RPK17117.1 hypothetical protein BH5_01421 [Bacillus subtilis]
MPVHTTQVYLHIKKDRKKEASHKFNELMRSLEIYKWHQK